MQKIVKIKDFLIYYQYVTFKNIDTDKGLKGTVVNRA